VLRASYRLLKYNHGVLYCFYRLAVRQEAYSIAKVSSFLTDWLSRQGVAYSFAKVFHGLASQNLSRYFKEVQGDMLSFIFDIFTFSSKQNVYALIREINLALSTFAISRSFSPNFEMI